LPIAIRDGLFRGILRGLYDFGTAPATPFRDEAADSVEEQFGADLLNWRKRLNGGSPTWARTRDLRINRLPLDLPANPHECSLSGVRASNISCPFHPRKTREGVI